MNTDPTPSEPQLSQAELLHLIREGDPPLTRRELRQRDAAEKAGLIVRNGDRLALAPRSAARAGVSQVGPNSSVTPSAPPVPIAPASPGQSVVAPAAAIVEPPVVTSADVLAGNVSAHSGLTRRELRELVARQTAPPGSQEPPARTTDSSAPSQPAQPPAPVPTATRRSQRLQEHRASPAPAQDTTAGLGDIAEAPAPPSAPAIRPAEETVVRRPVIRPSGALTGEYTGQFEPIREALANTGALPAVNQSSIPTATPATNDAPQRRSIFDADLTPAFTDPVEDEFAAFTDTNAADLSAVMDTPMVTDNLIPEVTNEISTIASQMDTVFEAPGPAEAEPSASFINSEAGPFRPAAEPLLPAEEPLLPASVPVTDIFLEDDEKSTKKKGFPDWHTLTALPRVKGTPQPEAASSTAANPFVDWDESAQEPKSSGKSPLWLTVLQWFVIAVVAVVLGMLVWYAINKGFGPAAAADAGIISPLFYLRI